MIVVSRSCRHDADSENERVVKAVSNKSVAHLCAPAGAKCYLFQGDAALSLAVDPSSIVALSTHSLPIHTS